MPILWMGSLPSINISKVRLSVAIDVSTGDVSIIRMYIAIHIYTFSICFLQMRQPAWYRKLTSLMSKSHGFPSNNTMHIYIHINSYPIKHHFNRWRLSNFLSSHQYNRYFRMAAFHSDTFSSRTTLQVFEVLSKGTTGIILQRFPKYFLKYHKVWNLLADFPLRRIAFTWGFFLNSPKISFGISLPNSNPLSWLPFLTATLKQSQRATWWFKRNSLVSSPSPNILCMTVQKELWL